MLSLVIFFIIFDVFSSISINQSQLLMKKLTKSSKNVAGKKGWFYSKEMLLFCWLKNWYLEGFYSIADGGNAVIGKIRARSLQKQPFHHQQMITDHPNFILTTDKKLKLCWNSIFRNQRFCSFFNFFYEKNTNITHFGSTFGVFMKRDTIIIECVL